MRVHRVHVLFRTNSSEISGVLVDLIARVEKGGGGGGVEKRLREKGKERKETKQRVQAPHISNSHATEN
jgi:hypothetical protein